MTPLCQLYVGNSVNHMDSKKVHWTSNKTISLFRNYGLRNKINENVTKNLEFVVAFEPTTIILYNTFTNYTKNC